MSDVVYVLHRDGSPLMPTSPAKARHLLDAGKAEVANRRPFTIRLLIPSGKRVQPVTVGVDPGAKQAGVAAVGNGRVLYQGEVSLRQDVHKRMVRRQMYRRTRRSRKCRYRAPRFYNRRKPKGWIPPSIRSRVDTTLKVVKRVASFLPVSHIRVETSNFDTQAMRAGKKLPGWAYQRGEQYGWENVKMYVRARDGYSCRYCGVVRPPDLEVDHVVPRSRGGSNRPDNLVAACHTCNVDKGNRTAEEFGRSDVQERIGRSLRAAAHTQAGKTATLEGLTLIATTEVTYGYVTKVDRQKLGLPKTHYYDAVAIACQGELVEPLPWYEDMRAVAKGPYRKRRGAHSQLVASLPREVFGFRLLDRVLLPDGREGFVKARRSRGSFAVADMNGQLITDISYKKLRIIERSTTLLVESREASDG